MNCEEYKKGGRVKKAKTPKAKTPKAKKPKKAKAKTPKKPREKRALRRTQTATGPMPTTGMGSVVFSGPQQAPSYFRAVAPEQQTFASLPGSLKALQEGQESIMKELNRRKAQESADRVFAEEEEKAEQKRKRSPSPVGSHFGRSTPVVNYDMAYATPIPIRPLSGLLPNTLNPFERKGTSTPEMIIPPSGSFRVAERAISPSYSGPMSYAEAMSAEPYRGADESLPIQPVASGQQMVPSSDTSAIASSSAFIPLGASKPENLSDSMARSVSAPSRRYTIPGTNQIVIPRPRIGSNIPTNIVPVPGGPVPIPLSTLLATAPPGPISVKQAKALLVKRQIMKDLKELRERKKAEAEAGGV